MSAPTFVCSNSNYDITVTSSQYGVYVMLVYSVNSGPWVVDLSSGLRLTTAISGGGGYFYKYTRNTNTTKTYKLYYWTNSTDYQNYLSNNNLVNYQEIESNKWVTTQLYTTPSISDINLTKCGNEQFSVVPVDGGGTGNRVPAGTTYTWTYTTSAAVNGATSNTISGTTSITQNVINATNSQTTVVYEVLATSAEGCQAENNFFINVLLNPAPQIPTVNDQVCSGTAYQNNFSSISGAIIPANTTYNWTYTNNTFVNNESTGTSSATSFTQTLSNTTNGSQTVIYTVSPNTNGCAGNPFTLNLGVKPTPYVSTQSTSICSNSTFSFTPSNGGAGNNIVPAGTTYTWVYIANASVSGQVSQSTPVGTISGTIRNTSISQTTQSYTITPTANGCDGTTFQANVDIVPNAFISDKTPANICSGGVLGNLNIFNGDADGDVVPGGTNFTWVISTNTNSLTGQYANSTPITQFGQNNVITNSSNINQSLVYTVTAASTGCSPTTFLVNLTVVPVAVINPKSETICSGNNFTNVTPVNGLYSDIVVAGTNYTWTIVPNSNIQGASSTNTPTLNISQNLINITNTTQVQQYNATSVSNSCASTSFSITISVNPTPKVSSKSQTICSEGTFSQTPLNASPSEIIPSSITYNWFAPSVTGGVTGGNSGTSNGTISGTLTNPTNIVQTATYSITPITGSCSGGVFTMTITVNPKASISPQSDIICSGNSFSIIPTNSGSDILPTGTLYNWNVLDNINLTGETSVGTYTNTIGQLLNNLTNTQQSVIYNITPISGTCVGGSFSATVTINPTPIIASKATSICSNGQFTVNLINNSPSEIVPASITYTWGIPNVTGNLTGGTNATAVGVISGTLNNPTNLIQTATYTITPIAGSCTGGVFTTTVTVNPIATIADKSQIICSGSAFAVVPSNSGPEIVPSGTLYNWTVIDNIHLTGESSVGTYTNTISQVLNNLTNSQKQVLYSVTPFSNNCSGGVFSVTVTIDPTPIILTKAIPICSGASFTLTPVDQSPTEIVPVGTSYTWTVIDNLNTIGESGVNTPTTNTISQTLSNTVNTPQVVNYTISPKAGNCIGSNFLANITVNPLPKASIDVTETSGLVVNDKTICSNETATISAIPVVGATSDYEYTWTVPIGMITPSLSSSNFSSSQAGTYSLALRNISTGCTSASLTSTSLSVNTAPTVGTISSSYSTVCVNSSIQLEGIGSSGGATPYTSYWWYTSTSSGPATTGTSIVNVTGVSAGNGSISYSVLDQLGCLSSRSTPYNITVYALPLDPIITPVNVVYDGLPHLVEGLPAAAPIGNDIIEWYANSSGGSVISPVPGITNVGNITKYAQAINLTTGCINPVRRSASVTITQKALSITANDVQKTYDRIAYTGPNSVSFSGFVNNESPSNLTGAATYTGTAINAINAGEYQIIPGGYSSTNYAITYNAGKLTINKKGLTITGANVENKIYDATDIAIMNAGQLNGIISGDESSLTLNRSAKFPSKNVGTNLPITSTSSISGSAASNYTLIPTINVTASITPKQINAIGLVTVDKIYDGTNSASVTGGGFNAAIDPGTGNSSDRIPYKNDNIQLVPSGNFVNKDVGNNITITSTSTITGADANNYTLVQPNLTARNITPKALTMAGLSVAAPKIYDGTTVAVVTGTPALLATETPGTGTVNDGKPYNNDIVSIAGTPIGTYNSKDVLTANAVSFSGLSLSGTNANNYTLTIQSPYASSILRKALSMFGLSVPSTKVYDGNTTAIVGGIPNLYNAVSTNIATASDGYPIIGDDVSIVGTPIGTYNSKDVISATYVAYSGLDLAGNQASNYSLNTQSNSAATITPLDINVKANAQTKVYGEQDPYFTFINDPLIGDDSFMGSLERATGESAGTYAINQGTLVLSPNYTIKFTSNTLTILKAEVVIQPNLVERTYGDQPLLPNATTSNFTATGLKNNETISSISIKLPEGLNSGNGFKDSAGTYEGVVFASNPIPENIDLNNYKISFKAGNIVVKKYTLTISAESKEKRKTQVDPPFTYVVSRPLVEGDSLVGQLSRESGEEVGFYKILQGSVYVNNNYDIKYLPAFLEILTIERVIVVPNAFTPNNDGLNDVIKIIRNSTITSINYFKIFDRSGKQIFETKNINEGWDGKLNGAVAESDAYYWMAEYNTWDNKIFQVKGSFVLIK